MCSAAQGRTPRRTASAPPSATGRPRRRASRHEVCEMALGPRDRQQDRSRLSPRRPVREAPPADGRLGLVLRTGRARRSWRSRPERHRAISVRRNSGHGRLCPRLREIRPGSLCTVRTVQRGRVNASRHLTFNQRVLGSSSSALTNVSKELVVKRGPFGRFVWTPGNATGNRRDPLP